MEKRGGKKSRVELVITWKMAWKMVVLVGVVWCCSDI